jgi:undecaprenyl diphosphate synthase
MAELKDGALTGGTASSTGALEQKLNDGGASLEVPRHIAIIPDGNRRWAKKRMLPAAAGHKAGVEAFKKMIAHATDIGVKYVTFYAFSTENWRRSQEEVGALMKLLLTNLINSEKAMGDYRDRVRFVVSGDRSELSQELVEAIEETERRTSGNTELIAVVCVNYGGRDEIVRAARKLAEKVKAGELDASGIDEAALSGELYVNVPDPDMIIRTSGEQRLSNFLLWQSAYSELYFSDVLWPDFDNEELDRAIRAFSARKRRYGK